MTKSRLQRALPGLNVCCCPTPTPSRRSSKKLLWIAAWTFCILLSINSAAAQAVQEGEAHALGAADGAAVPQPVQPVNDEDQEGVGAGGDEVEAQPVVGDGAKGDADATVKKLAGEKGNTGFIHAFIATLSVIVVSELGDKTFFISAIMSMRHSRLTVFAGAITALSFMHAMSALFGTLATLIPRKYTFYISSGLFAIFGIKMLREGWVMSPDEGQEEYEETQAELKKYEDDQLQARSAVTQDPETGIVRAADTRFKFLLCVSPLFIQAATLNFLAEWGDRSQIAAIILAAREDVLGVIIGGILGHALCTGLAVVAGRYISQKLSVRTVTLIGGVVFLIFAASAFFIDPTAT